MLLVAADIALLLLLVQCSALSTGILALRYTRNDVFFAVKEAWISVASP
jgi:hypothetical protein